MILHMVKISSRPCGREHLEAHREELEVMSASNKAGLGQRAEGEGNEREMKEGPQNS